MWISEGLSLSGIGLLTPFVFHHINCIAWKMPAFTAAVNFWWITASEFHWPLQASDVTFSSSDAGVVRNDIYSGISFASGEISLIQRKENNYAVRR
jgi:hypothetical protein